MQPIPSKDNYQTYSYQTRLVMDDKTCYLLEECASLFSVVERKLFADFSSGKKASDLKVEYLKKYQITARHFNAIRVQLEGKIASIQARQSTLIANLEVKIKGLLKTIQKLEKKKAFLALHQKRRALFNQEQKLNVLKEDKKNGKVRLCFGSKSLFRAQFNLAANGYKTHEEWLEDWQKLRDNSFFLLGSKDEINGNQSCTATLNLDGSLNLRIRLPDCIASNSDNKYVTIFNVYFKYGQKEIIDALKAWQIRKSSQKIKDPFYKNQGLAISYRFKRDDKGWRVFVSTGVKQIPSVTSTQNGVFGLDINANHLAITETDRFGNPISHQTIKLNTYGKSCHQTKALIGDACARIISQAKEKNKTLVIENLDFQKKKTQLKDQSPSQARMLSSLAYSQIKTGLKSRAWRRGVIVEEVNPAFTSIIGRVKFAKRYGLSIHHAAALSIGRRYLKFSERVSKLLEKIPDGKDGHVALSLPVRNADKHVWSLWKVINRKLKTVLAAHFRAKRNRSSSVKSSRDIKHPEPCRRNSDT